MAACSTRARASATDRCSIPPSSRWVVLKPSRTAIPRASISATTSSITHCVSRDSFSTPRSVPEPVVDGNLALLADAVGTPATVLPTVKQVTCRPARTFAQWTAEHADDFRAD